MKRLVGVVALASIGACSSSSVNPPPVGNDAGSGPSGASAWRPPPVFLEDVEVSDLLTIDPAFAFGVTQRHAADETILGSRWGRHGGPMVTRGTYGASDDPVVVRWDVAGDAIAKATETAHPFVVADGLPSPVYYGADGMVDLPGPFALLSYTGTGSPFPGEALLYSRDYDAVLSRAHVNGFYSGIGIDAAPFPLLVSSALSSLSASASDTNDNGLYVATLCDRVLIGLASCPPPRKLFGWNGSSGPVAADVDGNVFVAASVSGGATSNAIHGVAYGELVAEGATVTDVTLAGIDSNGTSTLAAVGAEPGAPGWVVGLGFDAGAAIYAAPFAVEDGRLAAKGTVLSRAIVPAAGVSVSVFTDSEGDLWVAATKGSAGAFLELRRKSQ